MKVSGGAARRVSGMRKDKKAIQKDQGIGIKVALVFSYGNYWIA